MPEESLERLYSPRILALAADIPHAGRLEAPAGSARRRSPTCGSSVTVDLVVTDGRVSAFAQNVKACALGQASASVLGAGVLGLDRDAIAAGRAALEAMLKEDGPTPPPPFEGLEVLRPAQSYRSRHNSILLAWDATLEAFDAATAEG
ncbi:MAG: iron-sulfur cluster assembly scaffold protein [Alphaproteobacteria bacterium]|nr:MAG: iron-sulfur cluster assembly scaffold protein [Alphaproteobacteria bacterium]